MLRQAIPPFTGVITCTRSGPSTPLLPCAARSSQWVLHSASCFRVLSLGISSPRQETTATFTRCTCTCTPLHVHFLSLHQHNPATSATRPVRTACDLYTWHLLRGRQQPCNTYRGVLEGIAACRARLIFWAGSQWAISGSSNRSAAQHRHRHRPSLCSMRRCRYTAALALPPAADVHAASSGPGSACRRQVRAGGRTMGGDALPHHGRLHAARHGHSKRSPGLAATT